MTTPAKTAFMTLVNAALLSVTAIKDVKMRPAIPTDWDSAKLPASYASYGVSRKRRENRIQYSDFNLQIETLVVRTSDALDAETVGESILSDIDAKIVTLAGIGPCKKINPISDDILYFDISLDKVMAVAVYEVTIAHEYGIQTQY